MLSPPKWHECELQAQEWISWRLLLGKRQQSTPTKSFFLKYSEQGRYTLNLKYSGFQVLEKGHLVLNCHFRGAENFWLENSS